jgi:hypothetical protein
MTLTATGSVMFSESVAAESMFHFCHFWIYCFLTGAIDNVENPVFVRGQQDIKDGLEWRRDLLVVQ